MSLLWLRVALGCYAVGLLYALVTLTRTSDLLSRIALHAAYLGMVFHFVSLSEAVGQFGQDRKSTRLNSSHLVISYAVFCLKKKKKKTILSRPTRQRPRPTRNIYGVLASLCLVLVCAYPSLRPPLTWQPQTRVTHPRATSLS